MRKASFREVESGFLQLPWHPEMEGQGVSSELSLLPKVLPGRGELGGVLWPGRGQRGRWAVDETGDDRLQGSVGEGRMGHLGRWERGLGIRRHGHFHRETQHGCAIPHYLQPIVLPQASLVALEKRGLDLSFEGAGGVASVWPAENRGILQTPHRCELVSIHLKIGCAACPRRGLPGFHAGSPSMKLLLARWRSHSLPQRPSTHTESHTLRQRVQ